MFVLSNTVVVPGYRITQEIYSGSKTLVYRGVREEDRQPIAIKFMRNEYPTLLEIAQFRNQYTITKNLNCTGIVKSYSLESYRNSYALILEDFGAISLKDYLTNVENTGGVLSQSTMSLQEFFPIASAITSALAELHSHCIIHKDIKPANILINPTTFEVKVTDFSIASRLPKEIQQLTNPNFLEGTLAYISPEQTGRMNRGINYRSDFYSLGITFFELLTGQLPFTTTDPMELVYCHIAKLPPKASDVNSSIPSILCNVISKLMAKNAEDRYQSALGIKHDLEMCLHQWQETGEISPFLLGQKDVPELFLIPEKLYGRHQEVETLLAAFDRVAGGTAEMVLVVGSSGIGKTAVVNEVHKPIVRQRSYFIKGKFDQFQRDIPLSGFVQAFQDLIEQLLSETDAVLQQWKSKILLALGEQARVIIDVIPKLEAIIGKQPPVTELSGTSAQNRFNLLFQRFIKIFTTKEHPLVIFLDDLQWADAASLKFMQLLMSQASNASTNSLLSLPTSSQKEDSDIKDIERSNDTENYFLLIGAYRDNEVSTAHPLYLTLSEISKTEVTINTIFLEGLNQSDLNDLLCDTLCCEKATVLPLGQLIFTKTQGNSFFIHQFIKYLYNEGIFKFNSQIGCWEFDIAEVKALALTDDVVEFMALQLEKLPTQTQEVLKLAACIGNQFDLKTLAIVYQKSELETAADLWTALVEGLVLPEASNYKVFLDSGELEVEHHGEFKYSCELTKYKFIHDRVQQVTYFLIPNHQKKSIHLRIGQLLRRNISLEEGEEKIFEVVNQLNMAVELIIEQSERIQLAQMNLIAGRKAIASTAHSTALEYLTTGIELLSYDSWITNYDLTLALYELAAQAAYLNGSFDRTDEFIEVVLAQANTLLDKVKVSEIKIQAYGAQGKQQEAVHTTLAFLKSLGIEFPEKPNQSHISLAISEIVSNLAERNILDLVHLPEMTEALPQAAMRLLSNVTAFAYQVVPELFALVVIKQVSLSLKYGNASFSSFAYVTYAMVLSGVLEDIESSYKFGKLALKLLETFNTKQLEGKIIQTFDAHIRPWKEHLKEVLKPLLEAYSISLETGDLEFAAYALSNYCLSSYLIGSELNKLSEEIVKHTRALEQINQESALNWNNIYHQAVLNLLGTVKPSLCLFAQANDDQKVVAIFQEAKDGVALLYFYFCKLHLCYLFQDYDEAVENATKAEQYVEGRVRLTMIPCFYFYDSLARLAIYSTLSDLEQKKFLDKIQANQSKMKHWAEHAPMNYLHKFYLVEAERYRVLGEYLQAMDNYDQAITLAQENEYIHEEALANELAAKFYLERGKLKIAQTYLIDAYYGYIRWGAIAKITHLEQHYPQILTPILKETKHSKSFSEKNTSSSSTILSVDRNNQSIVSRSNTSISDSLDLEAVIKASVTLSGEIQLEQQISTIMQVVMENAGASKCVLILHENQNGYLTIAAVSSTSTHTPIHIEFPSTPLESSRDVPITLINYVKRTREILVLDDLKDKPFLIDDKYILAQQPKSLLSLPIINQGKLLGILYLENNLTAGAFTHNRVELLKLISTQAAISLENAMLYQNLAQATERLEEYNHTLEEKVAERTREIHKKNQSLKKALKELRNTQTQLIQSEKMSSLGQMIAGIAHEINNPINFIHGNVSHAREYVQSLLELIEIYRQEVANTSPLIKEKVLEIELDFLVKDLPKLLDSMFVGTSRIRNIVLGLRNFSRLDEAEMKPVDIHEGMNNTLMILHHRLKAKRERTEITVIKEYGQLPPVTCYASELNQVFMNIIVNAIDALEEGLGTRNKGQGIINSQSPIPTILIRTLATEKQTVKILIADNGSGIPANVQQRIFDPFFTTKPVGSGTGLGLSISYQIIVDKHKGNITCNSTLGKGTEFLIEIPMKQ
ncbi:AAA family ATPase [Scytonema sp. NUACC26]|uniref:ATP-binding sensor histidine kinase n=1 Tax=Scytonema sp. NUACC26 TaxID=3140176 RepID=UPI0034DCB901